MIGDRDGQVWPVTRMRPRWLAAAGVLALLAVLVLVISGRGQDTTAAQAAPATTTSAVVTVPTADAAPLPGGSVVPATPAPSTLPWPPPPADPTARVAAAVADAAGAGVRQSVVVLDRRTGAVLAENAADEPYPALSLVKLMIAADLLDGAGQLDGSGQQGGSDQPDASAVGQPGGSDLPVASAVGQPDANAVARLTEMISRSDDVTASDLYSAGGGAELLERVAERFGLTGTVPTPDGEYWGNVQTTAADMASLLGSLLADPAAAPAISAMQATTAFAADGVDQRFGMGAVPTAGSKQAWGCCLSGLAGIHSVGFTADRIVVVLSGAEPDDENLGYEDGPALAADPGGQISIGTVSATVRAALGGPAA